MPIGPSHGSRGGSSSFGGGHSGGSSRSSRSSGSSLGGAIIGGLIYSMFANRRRRHFHNHYGYDPSPDEINSMPRRATPTKYLIFAIVFAIISAITMFVHVTYSNNVKSLNNTISIMKNDYYNDYKPMFDKATESGTDGYYITTATFKNYKYISYSDNPTSTGYYLDFVKDNISYYFIVYSYYDLRTGELCNGTTYSQFSANEVQNLNGKIKIAYFSKNGEPSYSMNTNYNFETCAEYKYYSDLASTYKNSATKSLLIFIAEIAVVGLFVTLYILKLKKYKKLIAQDEELLFKKRQAETEKAQAEAEEAKLDVINKNRFCQYCGSKIDPNTNSCTSCGASVSE